MLPSAARLREIALLNGIALTTSQTDDPIEAEPLQIPALSAPHFGPLQVIRRQVPQRTYFGAGLWRPIRHATQQSLAAACSIAAGVWEGVCLLPGDLRGAAIDLAGGGAAILRHARSTLGEPFAHPRFLTRKRAVAALAALAIAVLASAMVPLDRIWSERLRGTTPSSAMKAESARTRIEAIKDAALASQPAPAAIAFDAILSPRHRDHGRSAGAILAARHPVLALAPTLKPTTRPTLATLERLWRDKVAAAAVAGSGPGILAAAPTRADEVSTIAKKPPELPIKTDPAKTDPAKTDNETDNETGGQDSTGWIFDWVHGDGVQHRLPGARGPRRNLGARRRPPIRYASAAPRRHR